jgi:hypothetical protein
MNSLLVHSHFVSGYLDDKMIFNKNEEEHAEDLQLLLTILETI